MTSALHDGDPYSWSQQQANLLRERRWAEVDADLVAEEIADMGNEIRNACFSYIRRILEHLLKLQYSTRHTAKNHWRAEVTNFRIELDGRLTRSIANQIDLPKLYAQAIRLAVSALPTEGPAFARRLPPECPWHLEQIVDEDYWPD